jgi:hypothetical protein
MWVAVPSTVLHGPGSIPGQVINLAPDFFVCTGSTRVSNKDTRGNPLGFAGQSDIVDRSPVEVLAVHV